MSTLKYWIWLAGRMGFTTREMFQLAERFGTAERAFFADRGEYELAGLAGRRLDAMLDKSLEGAERVMADCDRLGVEILTLRDAGYPERLAQIDDPPLVLYRKGREIPFDERVAIGVVGARKPSPYGVELAGRLGLDLARRGALVISGIAQGIDTAALHGALKGGGQVVSVLGCGIDVVYPRENGWLYEDVAAAGALLSEYPPGTQAEGWRFPVRNRIISGLSLGVAAVEAAGHSGTLVTARLALEQNRDVFAFPGPVNAPMSAGTNRLIQRGEAKLILGAEDILCEYDGSYPGQLLRRRPLEGRAAQARLDRPIQTRETPPVQGPAPAGAEGDGAKRRLSLEEYTQALTDDEREILAVLAERALQPDDLVERTQTPAKRVLSALTMLQVRGYVEERPGKRFASCVILETQGRDQSSHLDRKPLEVP